MHPFTYPERIKLLGLERLKERRIRADILLNIFIHQEEPVATKKNKKKQT